MNFFSRSVGSLAVFKALLMVFTAALLGACGSNTIPSSNNDIVAQTAATESPISATENSQTLAAISVKGNQILFNGKPGSIAGPSLFWSNDGWGGEKYYNREVVSWVKQDWNAKVIRAAMGVGDFGGYISAPESNKAKVIEVIEAAIAEDIYVIIDWHSHDAEKYQAEAIAFFTEMATRYGHYNHIIYELYNEPLNTTSWKKTIKPYAEAVIAAIRAIDPDNLIIVGTPTWSQDVDIASRDPIIGYRNIAYTLHFYAGTHKRELRRKATKALNNGIALFVTEWGSVNADGDGPVNTAETLAWMKFLKAHNISHVNWSLNDKQESSSILKPDSGIHGNWTSADLTSSGQLVKNLIKNHNR